MKKILLSVAAVFAAMSVNAQEIAVIDADAIGIGADAVELAAGTELMKTESVTCSILFTDNFKATGLSENNVTVNDVDFGSTTGIQGSTNPPAAATEGTYPEQGCIYSFVPSKDGFLYVIHKASANKNYVVWENKLRVPYIFSAADGGAYDLNTIEGATVTVDGITNIADEYVIAKAQEIIGTEGLGAGTCVIKVQVFKDCQYDVHATGSKMTMAGFIFDETGDATIKAGDVTLLDKGQIPGAEPAPAAPVYSVIGTLVGGWDVVNDVDMQLVNGLYTATIDNVAAGSYEWKIRQDHAWTINWGDNGDGTGVQDGPNFKAEMPEGGSITITFDPATAAINAYVVGGAIEPADAWKVEGAEGAMEYAGTWAGNWWNLTEDMNADVSGYDYLWIDYDGFEGEIQFGIFYSEWQKTESWGEVWYTDQIILTEAAGVFGLPIEKTKVIEKGVGGVDSEYKGDIYAKHGRQVFTQDRGKASKINIKGIYFGSEAQYNAAKEASAIQGVKTIKNDGAIYNVAGQKVSASYKGLVIKNGKKYIQK